MRLKWMESETELCGGVCRRRRGSESGADGTGLKSEELAGAHRKMFWLREKEEAPSEK